MTEQAHAQESAPLSVKEFQEGIRQGKIVGCECARCGHKQIDIIGFCPACHSPDLKKVEFSNIGTVLTYTIQLVAPEQFLNEVPYAWAVIELDDGARLTGWIPFISKPSDLPIGQRVTFKKSYLPGMVFQKI